MLKARTPETEITMVAFASDEDGRLRIVDIVETWRYAAPTFARRWYRDPEITEMAVMRGRPPIQNWRYHARTIFRGKSVAQ